MLNYDRFQKNSGKIAAYCKKNKSKTLPTAIKNIGLWQKDGRGRSPAVSNGLAICDRCRRLLERDLGRH